MAIDQARHFSEVRGEVQRVIEIMEMACSGRGTRQPLGEFCGVAPINFPALVFADQTPCIFFRFR